MVDVPARTVEEKLLEIYQLTHDMRELALRQLDNCARYEGAHSRLLDREGEKYLEADADDLLRQVRNDWLNWE